MFAAAVLFLLSFGAIKWMIVTFLKKISDCQFFLSYYIALKPGLLMAKLFEHTMYNDAGTYEAFNKLTL